MQIKNFVLSSSNAGLCVEVSEREIMQRAAALLAERVNQHVRDLKPVGLENEYLEEEMLMYDVARHEVGFQIASYVRFDGTVLKEGWYPLPITDAKLLAAFAGIAALNEHAEEYR